MRSHSHNDSRARGNQHIIVAPSKVHHIKMFQSDSKGHLKVVGAGEVLVWYNPAAHGFGKRVGDLHSHQHTQMSRKFIKLGAGVEQMENFAGVRSTISAVISLQLLDKRPCGAPATHPAAFPKSCQKLPVLQGSMQENTSLVKRKMWSCASFK